MKKRNQSKIVDMSSEKDLEKIYYASTKQSDKQNEKSSGTKTIVTENNKDVTKQKENSSRKFVRQKSQRIEDSDSEDFRQKSLDIVVDVHCENEDSGRKANARSQSFDYLDKRTRSNESRQSDLNITESQDSLDLIEEIKDTPRSDDIDRKQNKWVDDVEATSSEVSGKRRRWKTVDDEPKSLRKRWTANHGKVNSFVFIFHLK